MSDYFDDVERELRGAVRRHAHLPWYVQFRLRHSRSLIVGLACLVVAGPALAASGVFKTGAPLRAGQSLTPRAGNGVAMPGSVKLLALRVSDPDGGPPWGLRVERTTRGLTCVQLGRLDGGELGVLGIDDAFSDDGLFHPLSVNYTEGPTAGCATTDAHGAAFVSTSVQATPASGLAGGCHGVAASLFANLPVDAKSLAKRFEASAERNPGPICPPAQLRDVYYGLLGPDAVSVTYPDGAGHPATETTVGDNGAYLVLGPPTGASCDPSGGCGNGYSTGPALTARFVISVSYRNGYVCELAQLAQREASVVGRNRAALVKRFPALAAIVGDARDATPQARAAARALDRTAAVRVFLRAHPTYLPGPTCPLLGYAAAQTQRVTRAQVKAPVSVHVSPITHEFCGRDLNRRPCQPVVPITIEFTARVAVTNIDSHYEVYTQFTPRGPCPHPALSGFASTNGDLRAGQRARVHEFGSVCHGTIHGDVLYAHNDGPSGNQTVPGLPGQGGGVLVGTFSQRID
ncbi:MAG TPA: hypothetical protein VG165_02625 [Solirubrobacteraceae bacterium]|jgi:hypothetical protein|nr:hypothetical protein [Solirubrobacteraceae bacterium]